MYLIETAALKALKEISFEYYRTRRRRTWSPPNQKHHGPFHPSQASPLHINAALHVPLRFHRFA